MIEAKRLKSLIGQGVAIEYSDGFVKKFKVLAIKTTLDKDGERIDCVKLSAVGKRFNGAVLKVNLYDGDGEIFITEGEVIWKMYFKGYETVTIKLWHYGKALLKAKSARIFATSHY